MTFGPRTFAPYLAAILVLWPIIAYMGAQGYTGAVAIAALLGLVFIRVKGIRIYAIACLAFIAWVVAAGTWSPEANDLLTGSVLAGSFSMDMPGVRFGLRSEEHTSELQSRPHISYAVFCLKKKKKKNTLSLTIFIHLLHSLTLYYLLPYS